MTDQAATSIQTSPDRGSRGERLPSFIHKFGPFYKLAEFLTTVRFVVQGGSMEPNFADDQYLLVNRMALWSGAMSRGDVAVLRNPSHWRRTYIKRIVGLPGERVGTVAERVFINGMLLEEPYLNEPLEEADLDRLEQLISQGHIEEWSLREDEYFVMGDHRVNSDDSRSFGPVNRQLIVGKAWIRYWPRSAWGRVR